MQHAPAAAPGPAPTTGEQQLEAEFRRMDEPADPRCVAQLAKVVHERTQHAATSADHDLHKACLAFLEKRETGRCNRHMHAIVHLLNGRELLIGSANNTDGAPTNTNSAPHNTNGTPRGADSAAKNTPEVPTHATATPSEEAENFLREMQLLGV